MLIGYVSDERYVALPDVAAGVHRRARRVVGGAVARVGVGPPRTAAGRVPRRASEGRASGRSSAALRSRSRRRTTSGCSPTGCSATPGRSGCGAGEASEFRVHSVEPYKLELWRYGWEPEFVRGLGWHDEHGPRAVDADHARRRLHADRRGVEQGRLRQLGPLAARRRAGAQRAVLLPRFDRVADGSSASRGSSPRRSRAAKMAVLASNITWNAYNNFGGRSNYIHADGLPPTPTVNSRVELKRYSDAGHFTWGADELPAAVVRPPGAVQPHRLRGDDHRPDRRAGRRATSPRPNGGCSAGSNAQGFAYDYYAETQLDDGTLDLTAYRVLVTAVHPEYWTRRMYERVKRWVFEEGGRLVYLGGNGLNCEVELRPDGTMVCPQRRAHAGWTSTGLGGFESRFAHAPRIRGEPARRACSRPPGAMTGAPYRVLDASHWAFAGTGLKDGDTFGEKSLHMRCPGGASGHETDKVSPSSPKNATGAREGPEPRRRRGATWSCFDTPSRRSGVLGRLDQLRRIAPGGRSRVADHRERVEAVSRVGHSLRE